MALRSQPSHHRPRLKKRSLQRSWRYLYLRLMRLEGTPEAIARGLAVGTFSGMFPIFGFQIIVSVILAIAIRGNKLAAAAATWISNPFTYVPLMAFNFRIGQWALQTQQLSFDQLGDLQNLNKLGNIQELNHLIHKVLSLGGGFLSTLFMGCFVVALITSTCAYFGGKRIVQTLRHRRRTQRLRRLQRSSSSP